GRAVAFLAVVGCGIPLPLFDWSELEPDLRVLKPRDDFYAKKRRVISDILFLMEVSASSLDYDQKPKVPRYADAGVPEVWIADLRIDLLHVNRNPGGKTYKSVLRFRPGVF